MAEESESKLPTIDSSDGIENYIFPIQDLENSIPLIHFSNYAKDRLKQSKMDRISKFKDESISANDFFTLAELVEKMKFDSNVATNNKIESAINASLEEMLDVKNNGRKKYGYLYPLLKEDGKNVRATIGVVFALENKEIPIQPFRELFAKFNRPNLMSLLSLHSHGLDSSYYKNPKAHLLRPVNKENTFNLYGLSIAEDIKKGLEDAFKPYKSFPLNDFFEDISEYYTKSSNVTVLNYKYYIKNNDIIIGKDGNPTREPELHFHFISIFNAIEELVINELFEMSHVFGLLVSKSMITDYKKRYNVSTSRNPRDYTDKLRAITDIVSKFFKSDKMRDSQAILIDSIQEGVTLLNKFEPFLIKLENHIKELKNNLLLDTISERINEHFSDKKTLYHYNPEKPFTEEGERQKNTSENIEMIKTFLLEKYYYYESTSSDGKIFYFLLSPVYCLRVLVNLGTHSFSNEVLKNQFRIAKILREKMEKETVPNLDSELDAKQKRSFYESFKAIEERMIKEEIRKEKAKAFNWSAALVGMATVLLMIAYVAVMSDSLRIFTASPLSLVAGFIAGRIFQKKKKNLLVNNPNVSFTSGVIRDPASLPYVEVIKNYLAPKNKSVEAVIHDAQKVRDYFKTSISDIRSKYPKIDPNLSDETHLKNLLIVLDNLSVQIDIPEKSTKEAGVILIEKSVLKDNFMKMQLVENFKTKFLIARQHRNPAMEKYYKFIIDILEQDFGIYI